MKNEETQHNARPQRTRLEIENRNLANNRQTEATTLEGHNLTNEAPKSLLHLDWKTHVEMHQCYPPLIANDSLLLI